MNTSHDVELIKSIPKYSDPLSSLPRRNRSQYVLTDVGVQSEQNVEIIKSFPTVRGRPVIVKKDNKGRIISPSEVMKQYKTDHKIENRNYKRE